MKLFFLIYLFIVIFNFFSETSLAFTLNSSTNPNLKGWPDSNIKLVVNTANCPSQIDVPGLIAEAAAVWNNAPTSSLNIAYGGSTTSTTASAPTTVYCEVNFQAVVGADQNAVPGAAAVNGSTGQISQGILYLNASAGLGNIGNFDHTTLKIILAHEIGHILGLGHSDSTNALMYYDASAKKTLNLSQDDIDGISYLYPSNELKDNKLAGCGLVKDFNFPKNNKMPTAWISFLVLLMPILILRIKLRRL